MIIKRDNAFNIVCNIRTPKGNERECVGTGSFIGYRNKVYLLTAAHVSKETNKNTYLALGDSKSQCVKINLVELVDYLDWIDHPIADMAILELNIEKHIDIFHNRCFPYDHINITKKSISRDEELTVIGFPMGLGIDGMFSPLTFRSYAASAFMTLERADKKVYSNFFCLENPSMGGYSGGPVLDLAYTEIRSMVATKEKTAMHGIIHGTMKDETGGKIALVTPMYYIMDLI